MDSQKQKVLVVEDDKFLRELFVRKISSEGFEVQNAIDAEQTFQVLTEFTPDFILLDLILPGEDGFSVLKKLKDDEDYVDIPVMVVSNLGQQEDVDKAMNLGAIDFLVKANHDLDEIVRRVKEHLGKMGEGA